MYPYLISQILKGVWFLRPEDAIAGHVIVNNILTGAYSDEKFTKTLSEITPIQQLSHEGESSYDKSPKGSTAIISVKGTMNTGLFVHTARTRLPCRSRRRLYTRIFLLSFWI